MRLATARIYQVTKENIPRTNSKKQYVQILKYRYIMYDWYWLVLFIGVNYSTVVALIYIYSIFIIM